MKPFTLVKLPPSDDTRKVLEQMVLEADRGELIGIAYVAMYQGRDYYVGYTGECARNPTWTRGMIGDLWDALRARPE